MTVLDGTGGIGKEIIPFYKKLNIKTIGIKDNWFTGLGKVFFEKNIIRTTSNNNLDLLYI